MTSRYQQVADALRAAILRGDYAPGETIPSQAELCETYRVSRWTIRQAVAVLEREGLVTPVRKRGTVVRNRHPVRLPLSRYSAALSPGGRLGPWETACERQGIDGRAEVVGVRRLAAPADIAALLEVEEGTTVVYRRRHMWARDRVAQVQEAWMPHDLVAGTPLARARKIVGGVYAMLAQLGHPPATVTETVRARLPTAEEARVLGLGVGTPVLALERVTRDHQGVALEVLRAAADADRVELLYDNLPLTPDETD
ncbi:GntR family transcriptional regulator [Thermobifida fusca]|uniref:GntR family transcriptional regulator n=1 Tax=Thermobifida fusca TaxID=2021 RepID=UPI00156B5AE2|nr:GntR family transcriptional regulator [Thermobifida fusca]